MNNMILPGDNYQVISKSIITNIDITVINMLYLPLIGSRAVMLYNMFLNDLDSRGVISIIFEHNHLLSNLRISCEELQDTRSILEGVGLLKTYFKKDTVNKYIYELYSPVSAHEFFTHPIFNVVLYNNVGKSEYERLVNCFKTVKISKDGYEEITKSFSQVFRSVPVTHGDMYQEDIRKYNKLKLNINTSFDINSLIETMPKQYDKKIFTKDFQELIISLAYLYDIDEIKMQNIIITCINEKGNVNREELRKVLRNHYQFDHSDALPTIKEIQPEFLRKPVEENSKMAKMIYTFETVSPYDFLKSKHNGAEPTKSDIILIENLLIDYKLPPGVVNVLIDYVLKTNDNKLKRNLIETIAGQWSRKNIQTVEEAMNTARKINRGEKEVVTRTKKVKDEVPVPNWFNQDISADIASEEEIKEMEEMLKEFS